jgi:hypothetical protein
VRFFFLVCMLMPGCGLFSRPAPVVVEPAPLPVVDCEVSHPEGLEDFWVVELGDERD